MPPPSPESQSALSLSSSDSPPYLPPRKRCDEYVSLYFGDIHSCYWLFPFEDFSKRLEETYNTQGESSSASWLCVLYSIFALVSDSSRIAAVLQSNPDAFQQPETPVLRISNLSAQDRCLTSADYMKLAKSLVTRVLDEADLDSIRSLSLLVRQTACHVSLSSLI